MSFYLNKVFLSGNLTQDPEIKTLQSSSRVCNFTIAITRVWFTNYNDPSTKNEETVFIRITAWNRLADKMADVKKGANIYVEGRLSQNKYQLQDGSHRSYIDVVADRISFITKHGRSFEEAAPNGSSDDYQEEKYENPGNETPQKGDDNIENNDGENTSDLWSN